MSCSSDVVELLLLLNAACAGSALLFVLMRIPLCGEGASRREGRLIRRGCHLYPFRNEIDSREHLLLNHHS